MCQPLSDSNWDVPCPLLGCAFDGQTSSGTRLEAGDRQGGCQMGRWRLRLLSRRGRLVLVKAVLSAILTYFMSVFRMPARVRHWIEGAMRRFFWRRSDAARGGGGGGGGGGRPCRRELSMPARCSRWPGRTSSATH